MPSVVLGVASVLFACSARAPLPVPTDTIVAEVRRIRADMVQLSWPADFSAGPVTVYSGRTPWEIDRSRALAVTTDHAVVLDDLETGVPYFFELVGVEGATLTIAERRLPLKGARNFRDLGGYQTADGHTVRWGRVFRSDSLSDLSRDDIAYLAALDIQLVCDFRSERERSDDPGRLFSPGAPESLLLPIRSDGVDPTLMRHKIRTGGIAGLELERTMQESYRSFVVDFSDDWTAMFRFLSQPENLPAVVHCTKGKDRTGFASALLLLALGVPEESVYEDYLLTNRYLESFRDFVLRWVPLYSFFRTDPDDLRPLLEARRSYLQASLDAIVELHGSIDAYLEHELGVTPARRAALREHLLSPAVAAARPGLARLSEVHARKH